jgi:ABC-type amino acid transport system permease subunit
MDDKNTNQRGYEFLCVLVLVLVQVTACIALVALVYNIANQEVLFSITKSQALFYAFLGPTVIFGITSHMYLEKRNHAYSVTQKEWWFDLIVGQIKQMPVAILGVIFSVLLGYILSTSNMPLGKYK